MKIIDCNGKERTAKSVKVIAHEYRNAISDSDNEVLGETDYAEVVIIGKTKREWTEWYPLNEFKENNPDIEI